MRDFGSAVGQEEEPRRTDMVIPCCQLLQCEVVMTLSFTVPSTS